MAVPTGAAAEAPPPIRFGMDINSIDGQTQAGVKPDYAMIWIGPWTLKSGWSGTDSAFARAHANGVTPVVQFYYWGDDISRACLENGCDSILHGVHKSPASWQALADQLSQHLQATLKGGRALIILESEFNKGDVTTYEPLDAYLAEKAAHFHKTYPTAHVVLGLGNWGESSWRTFDRAAAASDLIGLQAMRGSTRDSVQRYEGVIDATLNGARTARTLFGKPLLISDIALSTYPEPDWAQRQAIVVGSLFQRLGEFKALDVQGLLYRSLRDSPNMDTKNYFGEAERHWGLAWATNGTGKPAMKTWVEGVKRERAPPPVLRQEAEAFVTKTTGRREADAWASGAARWNLWGNGHVAHAFKAPTATEYRVLVWARGQPLGGVGPHMVVSVDDRVVFQADPRSDAIRPHGGSVNLGAGNHQVKVAFTNDARNSNEDRNLLLDRVVIQPILRVEAESFATRLVGGVQPDAAASEGKRWNLWSMGSIAHTVHVPEAGEYEVAVRAQGQSLGGIAPHMILMVDDETVHEADPAPGAWRVTGVTLWLSDGPHHVRIRFTNNAANQYEDRNLLVDWMDVARKG